MAKANSTTEAPHLIEQERTTTTHLMDAQDCLYVASSKLHFLRSVQPMEGLILEGRILEGLHTILAEIEDDLQTVYSQIQEERDDQAIVEMRRECRS